MILQTQLKYNNLLEEFSPKFLILKELTPKMRLDIASIAYTAQTLNTWGAITKLSKQYNVSRDFIYKLINTLKKNILTNICSIQSYYIVEQKRCSGYDVALQDDRQM
jgi:hypothetical protein